MDKTLTVMMGGIFVIVMLTVVTNMTQVATPQPQYQCPICGEWFFTYDELYQHFTTEHPAEPIEIIWE